VGGLGQAARLARSLAVPVALLLAWEGISLAGWVTPLILRRRRRWRCAGGPT